MDLWQGRLQDDGLNLLKDTSSAECHKSLYADSGQKNEDSSVSAVIRRHELWSICGAAA
jgi:hypothetical protein